uniref:RNMT-activating mRNA cap methyltransferase subunit n=1 Tax=Schistosoma mansoni TaxID=6183 RepID=A0A5K4F583_SCHMA
MSETPDRLISLEELETMFKDRYTDKDVNYQKYLSNANVPPPIIPHWDEINRERFNHRSQRNNNYRFQRNNFRRNSLD